MMALASCSRQVNWELRTHPVLFSTSDGIMLPGTGTPKGADQVLNLRKHKRKFLLAPLKRGGLLRKPMIRNGFIQIYVESLPLRQPPDYGASMSRLVLLSIAIVLSLLPVVTQAEPAQKRPAPRWQGYGFLPGYHQPPNNSLPPSVRKASGSRTARHNRRPWYIDPTPSYYGYDGDWHYFGRPGFYGGRYNGGSFGPCWTRTPIGPVWNCG